LDVYIPSISVRTSSGQDRSRGDLERPNILLVEDEESLARLGQRVLDSAGFEVTAHTSSLHALESFRANPKHFDLLITDNSIPHMTGLELVGKILAIPSDIPVLMVSGVGKSMSVEDLKERGVDRLLSEPYESAASEAVVKEIPGPGRIN
jgi:CheY-like chemotaxis protein